MLIEDDTLKLLQNIERIEYIKELNVKLIKEESIMLDKLRRLNIYGQIETMFKCEVSTANDPMFCDKTKVSDNG